MKRASFISEHSKKNDLSEIIRRVFTFTKQRLLTTKRTIQRNENGSQKIGKTIFKLSMSFVRICNNRYTIMYICAHSIKNMRRNYMAFWRLIAMVKYSSDRHCCLLFFTIRFICILSLSLFARDMLFYFFYCRSLSHKMTRKVPHRENLNIT